jgi:hypothetical protein
MTTTPNRRWSFVEMITARHACIGISAGLLILLGSWFICRAATLGLNNIFSREYTFSDSRPLTEAVALEVTRNTLEIAGYAPSHLKPVEFRPNSPDELPERFFARNTVDPQSGYVLWGPENSAVWNYSVSVDKHGNALRCRVCRSK